MINIRIRTVKFVSINHPINYSLFSFQRKDGENILQHEAEEESEDQGS